jgi:hypothetical protein
MPGKKPRVNSEGFHSWPTTVRRYGIFHRASPYGAHAPGLDLLRAILGLRLAAHRRREDWVRRVYGMELSEVFCDVIINRWQAFSGKTAVLDGEGATYAEMRESRLGVDKEAA